MIFSFGYPLSARPANLFLRKRSCIRSLRKEERKNRSIIVDRNKKQSIKLSNEFLIVENLPGSTPKREITHRLSNLPRTSETDSFFLSLLFACFAGEISELSASKPAPRVAKSSRRNVEMEMPDGYRDRAVRGGPQPRGKCTGKVHIRSNETHDDALELPYETHAEVERPRLAFVILNRVERTDILLNLPRPMSLSPR